MKRSATLGDFEQIVLLAILRIQEQGAYGLAIRSVIAEKTQRQPTAGAIYTTLERLEDKGYLESRVGESTPERGGRAKRYYRVSADGVNALKNTQQEYRSLLDGLSVFGESHA